jgi:acyl-CoA reductase-like NAD-dependent aldehyde dehydrogenase
VTAVQQLFIDGVWRDAQAGGTNQVVNSFTGAVVTTAASAHSADVDGAVAAAAAAFEGWSTTPPAERRDLLAAAGDLLESRAEQIAGIVTEETAGTFGWGMFNVGLAAGMFRAAGELAVSAPTSEPVPTAVPGMRSTVVRAPLGVCVGIAPWNAPVILGARAIIWALALGNTVVFKASEHSPRVHGAIVAALADAGAPAGVVNLLTNDPDDAAEVVGALVEHPQTAHINFTGSTRVGRIIASTAAPLLKPTLLELGGKAPLVVLDDADLAAAAAATSFGAFMNAGQICMSTERVVVDVAVKEEFERLLVERAANLPTGDPSDPGSAVGPLVGGDGAVHVAELVDDAREKGARVLAGGTRSGALHEPTVLSEVTPAMRIYAEESFGPVVAVIGAAGLDDAVRIANDTPYGLAAAVFGRDTDRALSVAARIGSGICHVNGATVHDEPGAPFGGTKASGWGRFGAGEVVHEFTQARWITISEEERHYPI